MYKINNLGASSRGMLLKIYFVFEARLGELNSTMWIKQEDSTKKLVPFSQLSKSGKVVNAYNALVLAEQISKSKK